MLQFNLLRKHFHKRNYATENVQSAISFPVHVTSINCFIDKQHSFSAISDLD